MKTPSWKQTSVSLPVIMSLSALAMVLGHVALFGVVHEPDEGTPAHVFQLLMVAQIPIVAFFAVRWLPRAPRKTLYMLALQAGAALAALVAVVFLT